MKSWVKRALRVFPAAALIAAVIPVAAGAQEQAPIPSYARHVDQIKGTISSVDGAYTLHVRDVRGYVDTVSLHQGTVINPTGIRLVPGFSVTITGHPSGRVFVADEIDTPYHFTPGVAYYPYAYYPYGYYPYPYPYFGPSIFFGFGRGWRR